MSVNTTELVKYRPFNGFQDPALPAGYWLSFLSILGDASAGLMSNFHRFQSSGQRSSLLYSLEQIMVTSSAVSIVSGRLAIEDMDPVIVAPSTGSRTDVYALTLEATGSVSSRSALNLGRGTQGLPLFLGQTNPDITATAGLNIEVNNTLAASLASRVQGFYWEPRSILADGGPQRPTGSVYGM